MPHVTVGDAVVYGTDPPCATRTTHAFRQQLRVRGRALLQEWLLAEGRWLAQTFTSPPSQGQPIHKPGHRAQDSTPLSHFGKSLKGHPSSRAPCGSGQCPLYLNYRSAFPAAQSSSRISFRNCPHLHTNCLEFYFQGPGTKAVIPQLHKLALSSGIILFTEEL